jgi:hypothetical protein
MQIEIKEDKTTGHIHISFKWKSQFSNEYEIVNIYEYSIGRKEDAISKAIYKFLKKQHNNGHLKY